MAFLIRLAPRQRSRETCQEFCQSRAHLPAWVAAHVAPREEQQVHPGGTTEPVCEDLPRDAADAAARRGATCRATEHHDQSPASAWHPLCTSRPRARACPKAAPPKAGSGRFRPPFAHRAVGLDRQPASALRATPL